MLTEKKYELLRFLIKGSERESIRIFNEMLSDYNVTANQAEALMILKQVEPISLKEIGKLLICEKGSPSRLIQSLVNKGLVSKGTDKVDKRKNVLTLTKKGNLLIPQINEVNDKLNKLILNRIDNDDTINYLIKIFSNYLSGTETGKKIELRYPNELHFKSK
ncbi:MarR family transcriptional regulator [Lactobacillus sp. ESL0679]|uniref:MarR family winged helix-turn-helix transcriptional regulator n=1 Tax=Lactobacillus sp. ESL0679 TaxID=2983209 RepID=UPI0023F6D84F|nr:winged helix DNA-binding protein [Lactobacillus sp. ESL0679]MDF7682206.1 MarR family transcriptional regulator [Lactobacillus sp. ESL0679]